MAPPLDSGTEVPASSRLAQVNAAILGEQTGRVLADDSMPERFRLVLPKETGHADPLHTGTQPDALHPDPLHPDALHPDPLHPPDLDPQRFLGDGKFKLNPAPFTESSQPFADRIGDRIFSGFGRIESTGSKNPWRLDYVDPSRCKSHAKFGLCFTMKLP